MRDGVGGAVLSLHPTRDAALAGGRRLAFREREGGDVVLLDQAGGIEEHWRFGVAG